MLIWNRRYILLVIVLQHIQISNDFLTDRHFLRLTMLFNHSARPLSDSMTSLYATSGKLDAIELSHVIFLVRWKMIESASVQYQETTHASFFPIINKVRQSPWCDIRCSFGEVRVGNLGIVWVLVQPGVWVVTLVVFVIPYTSLTSNLRCEWVWVIHIWYTVGHESPVWCCWVRTSDIQACGREGNRLWLDVSWDLGERK